MDENQVMESVTAAPEQQQQQQSNLLTQEQVNKIVAREKAKAAESARREAEERYQSGMDSANSIRMQQQQRNEQVPRQIDADALYQQVQERFNQDQEALRKRMEEQRLKEQMTQVANNYLQKVAEGKKNYEDFEDVTKDFDPTAFPQLTFLLSGMENAGDILYDLSKNPMKLAAIDRLAERNPRQAQSELVKLSKSISDNRQAQMEAQSQVVPDPLDRLAPSRVTPTNGKLSVRDLRNQPWLRG